MTIRYIGSKARLAGQILERVGTAPRGSGFFVDSFCGTGVVAERAADRGWPIRLNDHLSCAVVLSAARLVSYSDASFRRLGGYEVAVELLNGVRPSEGFIHEQYSPASLDTCGIERKYFTTHNASKIDGARGLIREWSTTGMISEIEERLLLADLLNAANRVANTAGTYGCFLSDWMPAAVRPLTLVARRLRAESVRHEVFNTDVSGVPIGDMDVAYFDPPYTKRQYAAYYHVLETIAVGDRPSVGGITGLRPWRDRASDFCYRTRALSALAQLVASSPARRTFLSYSSEGHVKIRQLIGVLGQDRSVAVHVLGPIGRYRPNRVASDSGAAVTEFLIELRSVPTVEMVG